MQDTPQNRVVESTVADLENYLKVSAQRIDISKTWDQSPPQEAGGQGLHEYLDEVCHLDT